MREAVSLTVGLLGDPTSRLSASVSGWKYPMSRESFILADIHDRLVQANFKKFTPYPRPIDVLGTKSASSKPAVGQLELRAALRARGHGS